MLLFLTYSFEVGIGYYPGTDGHQTFTSFTPILTNTDIYSHIITHVDTMTVGRRPIYITVQARSALNTRQIFKLSSRPIYIKSDINEWDSWLVDGTDPSSDVEFQVSTTEINAYFSIGSHCPVMYTQWAIEDANGTIVQDYIKVELPSLTEEDEVNNEFMLSTDQVRLYNEESYRVLVQAIDYTGQIFTLRSNGFTVTTDELVPSIIQDGPIPNEDLNHQEPIDYLSAHWTEFGDGTPQQEILYYEVAAGSNMGYPNTRSNIAPFTNIGLNTSYTFTDLTLTPEAVVYSMTVRATAVAGAIAEATSNGITVGHRHSIYPGHIILTPYSSSNSQLSVYWEEFQSIIPIRSYEVAVGTVDFNSSQLEEICYLSRFENKFEVLSFISVDLDTSLLLSNLSLTHNTTYYVTIRSIDEANNCLSVTSSGMLVDLSEPISLPDSITLGPPESLIGITRSSPHVIFVQSGQDFKVSWNEFVDDESDIDYYEITIFEQIECGSNENLSSLASYPDYVSVGLDRSFAFNEPGFVSDAVYVVGVQATNRAGLYGVTYSQPIVLDVFTALPGTVKDGLLWEEDLVFQSDLSMLSGVFSHAKLASQYPGVVLENDPCPNTTFYSLTRDDATWNNLSSLTIITGIVSPSLMYSDQQINISSNGLRITTEYDDDGGIVSGGYYTTAVDLSRDGGLVSLDIKTPLGQDSRDRELQKQSIASLVLIDNPASDTLIDFEYELRDSDRQMSPDVNAVGLQIHQNYDESEQKIIIWSSFNEPLQPISYVAHNITTIDLTTTHKYTLDFQSEQIDTGSQRWVDVYIDDQLTASLHGIAALSNNTQMVVHVFNRNGFVPQIQDGFNPPGVETIFANVSLPSLRSHICDFGQPFYSATSPITQFNVGVGTSPGVTDITPLKVYT